MHLCMYASMLMRHIRRHHIHIKPYLISQHLQHILPQWHPTSGSEHPPKESCDLAPCGQHMRTVVCAAVLNAMHLEKCRTATEMHQMHQHTALAFTCNVDIELYIMNIHHIQAAYMIHRSNIVKPQQQEVYCTIRRKQSWWQPFSFASVESGHSDWLYPETPNKSGMMPTAVLTWVRTHELHFEALKSIDSMYVIAMPLKRALATLSLTLRARLLHLSVPRWGSNRWSLTSFARKPRHYTLVYRTKKWDRVGELQDLEDEWNIETTRILQEGGMLQKTSKKEITMKKWIEMALLCIFLRFSPPSCLWEPKANEGQTW